MADVHVVRETKSWGSRIIDSIKGFAIGVILFFTSFGVLYWNEGRTDMSKIATQAKELSAEKMDESLNGEMIWTTGKLDSSERIGDRFLQEGNYIALYRTTEMYAWEETSKKMKNENLGGSQTTETTYSYHKKWLSSPESSSFFEEPNKHANPPKAIENKSTTVQNATVGIYTINAQEAELPKARDVTLSAEKVILEKSTAPEASSDNQKEEQLGDTNQRDTGEMVLSGNYIFQEKGSLSNPQVGDIRISYTAVNPTETATIFGKLNTKNKSIVPFYTEKNDQLYRVFEGEKEDALAKMHSEYTVLTWIFRAVGFIMMWLGLMMIFTPFSTLLAVIPFLGSLGGLLIQISALVIALLLSILAIVLSMILHNICLIIAISVLIVVGGGWHLSQKKKQTEQTNI